MQLLDDLRLEHELIESVALSFRAFVRSDDCRAADADPYLRFFTSFAGAWHHEREEDVLFPALQNDLLLPADRGPMSVLLDDHHRMASLLGRMHALTSAGFFELADFRAVALRYTQALLLHIDAENSVLFPECEDRLRRGGVGDLTSRALTGDEEAARTIGESLVQQYPPAFEDRDLARGDGCALCPSYGLTCSGIEREWWNEWQWEEFDEHVASS